MTEYILFIDETLKTTTNPYFCLSGICAKRKYYEDEMTKIVNDIKKSHFGFTDVIFHYSEMNNKKGDFEIFKDGSKREAFWLDYVSAIRKMDFISFGVYCDQRQVRDLFQTKQIRIYDIAFEQIMNSYVHFLKKNNGIGSICVESRLFNENANLQNTFNAILNNGTSLFSSTDINKYISTIGFIVKGDNCIGLQIADIAPSALLRKINDSKDYNNLGEVYTRKLYQYGTEYQGILGMRKLL